jgi:simple sugar transport system ATP-binding protein
MSNDPPASPSRSNEDAVEQPAPVLVLDGASRRFGELWAVRALDLTLEPGRLHAIVGENGAGKSTALKMLAGHLTPTSGRVLVDGAPLEPVTPEEAMRRGIGMVHQHFMLVEAFTALENLVLGAEPTRALGALDLERAAAEARRIADETGLSIDLRALTERLSVGERQRLEILRVLYRGARAILLDEPTAVLSPVEVGDLYRTLRRLAASGATIAVVTHRLDEVVRHADEVTVMRRGRRVHAEVVKRSERDAGLGAELTRAIMGGEPPEPAEPPPLSDEAAEALALDGLRVFYESGSAALDGLSLSVRAGEVVGVAGVEGNGQRELVRALAGLERLAEGEVRLGGERLFGAERPRRLVLAERAGAVRRALGRGLSAVHEDRHHDELVLEASVADNLVLGDLGDIDDEAARVRERFGRFKVYPDDSKRLVAELSGGNQQKVVMARALDRKLRALVLAQPTRGVDVGTARTIQRAIADAAAAGAAVLVISVDLGELRALSHRIVVLRRGKIVAELDPSASDETIGRAMLGTEAA